jgi:hypothetical protein
MCVGATMLEMPIDRERYVRRRRLEELNKRRIEDWHEKDMLLMHKLIDEEADRLSMSEDAVLALADSIREAHVASKSSE